jgi:hypothetical protein
VTVAVVLMMGGARISSLGGTKGAVAAGALGGFMNSAAGVGGPPYSLYALNAGLPMQEFVPNAQFYGIMVNVFSVAANGVPKLSGTAWTVATAALTTGALIGYLFTGGTTAARPGLVEVTGGVALSSAVHRLSVWLRFGMRPAGHRGAERLQRGLPSSK